MTKKEAVDRKHDLAEMAERQPDQKAAERFRRKPYSGIKMLIRRQGEQIGDTAKYLAEKYNIRGDNDDKSSEISNTDLLDT